MELIDTRSLTPRERITVYINAIVSTIENEGLSLREAQDVIAEMSEAQDEINDIYEPSTR